MGSDRKRGNREVKKPKKEKPQASAAAPSLKGGISASARSEQKK
ncbi:hypothetical protein OPKNFCMD_4090 [Methylobacterium crusticola]|uniref:Uncharacterized protein n=1 Tax=Methylobacterium crusticola TaxID=1697972 RepID=A0ABQ4R3D0_9HYPH|nr:hypothetical protein [Methylobacterium crusticola]GJD51336.1 hypothetical protein OPKNFCMD_4090 [Methylobacterium crusticola]